MYIEGAYVVRTNAYTHGRASRNMFLLLEKLLVSSSHLGNEYALLRTVEF